MKWASWLLICWLHSLLRELCSLIPYPPPRFPSLSVTNFLLYAHLFFKNMCISWGIWLEHLCEPCNCEIVEVLFPPVFTRAKLFSEGFWDTASILDSNQPAALLVFYPPSSFLFLPLFLFTFSLSSILSFLLWFQMCPRFFFHPRMPSVVLLFSQAYLDLPSPCASKAGLSLTPIVPGLHERDQFSHAVNTAVSLHWSPAMVCLMLVPGNECVLNLAFHT